jgi:hypothetical protein
MGFKNMFNLAFKILMKSLDMGGHGNLCLVSIFHWHFNYLISFLIAKKRIKEVQKKIILTNASS